MRIILFLKLIVTLFFLYSCNTPTKKEAAFIILHTNNIIDLIPHEQEIIELKDSLSNTKSGLLFVNTGNIIDEKLTVAIENELWKHVNLSGLTYHDLIINGNFVFNYMESLQIPVISSNVLPKYEQDKRPLPYIALKRDGIKLSFLGYTELRNEFGADLKASDNYYRFEVQTIADAIEYQKMALTHSNANIAILQSPAVRDELSELTSEIDLVLGLETSHYIEGYKSMDDTVNLICTELYFIGKELKSITHKLIKY